MMTGTPVQSIDREPPRLRSRGIAGPGRRGERGDALILPCRSGRARLGTLDIALYCQDGDTGAAIVAAPRQAVLVMPVLGTATLRSNGKTIALPSATPYLLADGAASHVVWNPSACLLAIAFDRARLNAAVSAMLGDGRRLAGRSRTLAASGGARGLEQAADRLARAVADAPGDALESGFYRALGERITALGAADSLLPAVRPVSEAMRMIRENHAAAFDTDGLATMVSVTAQTLRKGFRTCLDLTVKEYIQAVRLDWARRRLSDPRELRSIAEIGVLAGFSRAPDFSRGFARHFGEPPSRTRARAVHELI